MYSKYYKDLPGVNTDKYAWINSQEADFGKKIRGERSFTEADIKAIERALEVSWVDIVEPLPLKKTDEKFRNRGLRYAAHMDEEELYQDLADSKGANKYTPVLCSYDEYGKMIIDYILEFKAENGLKFLINNEHLRCDKFLRFDGRIYRAEDLYEELWDWIISLDDSELFLKAMGEENLFDCSFCSESEDKLLEQIIGSKNIFEALCQERVDPKSNLKYIPGLLFKILNFSLAKKHRAAAQIIINTYKKFIEERIAALQNEASGKSSSLYVDSGSSVQRRIYRDDTLIMHAWDFYQLSVELGEFKDQIEDCSSDSIIKRLEVKNLCEMKNGDSFVKDGIYYIKKEPDLSIEALKYLTAEKGCKYLPAYIGEESGVTKIHAYRAWGSVKFGELGKMLGEIHSLSQEKLGVGRVYMYSKGFKNGFGYTDLEKTKVITNWRSCEIGTPIIDIITAFLNCGYFHERFYEKFIQEKDTSYKELSEFLNAYPDKRVIVNFGDLFNEELDKMLKSVIQDTQEKNAKKIETLYIVKSFAEIYRHDLNLITNQ